jgi:hypothetical protein
MQTIACINCGLRYKVRDDLVGKRLKCPNCGVPIHASGGTGAEVSDEQLRAEVLRLAGSGAAVRPSAAPRPVAGRARPAETPASQEPRAEAGAPRRGYTAVIVALSLVAGAAVAGFYFVLH